MLATGTRFGARWAVSTSFYIVVFLCSSSLAFSGEGRFWYDRSARHRVFTSIEAMDPSSVVLARPNGKTIAVPLDRLHQSDQAYIDALFRMRSSALHLSRSPYARGSNELAAIYEELVKQNVPSTFAFYLARPAAVYLAETAKDFRPYSTGQFVLGDRRADFFTGRWVEPRNSRGNFARGMQYRIAHAPQADDMVGLLALSVRSLDGRLTAITPEDFDEIIVMPRDWKRPTYTPFPSRLPLQPFTRLRGPMSPKLTAPDTQWKYRLVYDGRNGLWTDEAALKGHQLRFEAELTWDESEILALLAEGKWRSYQGDDHALIDRIIYVYQSEEIPDAHEVVAAIREYTRAIKLLSRFCDMVRAPLASSDMFYLGSEHEAFSGPQMRAALWGDYGEDFVVDAIKPRADEEVPLDRALQVEPTDWQLVERHGGLADKGHYRGKLALDPYRSDPTCLIEANQVAVSPLKDKSHLARANGFREWQTEMRPVYTVDTQHASETPLLAEGTRWLADAYLRRSCMYLVLGGEKRLHDALDDLKVAMALTPERPELVLPAKTIRSRVRSALGQLVEHFPHSHYYGDDSPSYVEARKWHAEAKADAEEVTTELAQQGGPDAVTAFWQKRVPPPVTQEIKRRRDAAMRFGYDKLVPEISMYAAQDMERRGFLFRDEAEVSLNHGIEFARVLFLRYGWRIIKQRRVFDWSEKEDTIRSRFDKAISALERETNFFSPYGIFGFLDINSDANKCFEFAKQFVPPGFEPKLATSRRQSEIEDARWQDKANRWEELLNRLDYEYLHRNSPWLLTSLEYLPAVEISSKAATLKPRVMPHRDLAEWFKDEVLRIKPTRSDLVQQSIDEAEAAKDE